MKILNNYVTRNENKNLKKIKNIQRIKFSKYLEFSELSLRLYTKYLDSNLEELAIINLNDINMMEQILSKRFKNNYYYDSILSYKVKLMFKDI
jgi:hypothetical protein